MRALQLLILITMATVARAQSFESNGVNYLVTGNRTVAVAPRVIDGVNAYSGTMLLPERVFYDGDNYAVTAIAPEAFAHSEVTHVEIPNSVTALGEAAFEGAGELTSVTISLNVKEIPDYCFAGSGLECVAIPEGVTALGDGAFEACDLLHTVFLPSTLRFLDHGVFDFCHTLSEIYCAAPEPPVAVEDDTFSTLRRVDVVVSDDEVAERYQDDPVWGNGGTFTLFSSEALAVPAWPVADDYARYWQRVEMRRELDLHLAYKVYNEADELVAVTAAPAFFLPATDHDAPFTIVPTTLLDDDDPVTVMVPATTGIDRELAATGVEQHLVWETPLVWAADGLIHVGGNHYGEWVNVFDLNGVLRYHRQSYNDDIPGLAGGIYLVAVGRYVTKIRV